MWLPVYEGGGKELGDALSINFKPLQHVLGFLITLVGVRVLFRATSQQSRAQTPPSSLEEKGSGVTSPNPWASSRSMEQPIKSQSSVYWNNAEATSVVPLKACYEIYYPTLSNL